MLSCEDGLFARRTGYAAVSFMVAMLAVTLLFDCGSQPNIPDTMEDDKPDNPEQLYFFTPMPADALEKPGVTQIPVPTFPGCAGVLGETGRDSRGHIWFGVSCEGEVGEPSAHLLEYIPATGTVIDRGDVVSELKRNGALLDGESQPYIYTTILQAGDGYLYFASTGHIANDTDRETGRQAGEDL